jgi:hypothetical protein
MAVRGAHGNARRVGDGKHDSAEVMHVAVDYLVAGATQQPEQPNGESRARRQRAMQHAAAEGLELRCVAASLGAKQAEIETPPGA